MPEPALSILIVGLEPPHESELTRHFAAQGHRVKTVPDPVQASATLREGQTDVVYAQSGDDAHGIAELRRLAGVRSATPVIAVCPRPTIPLTVEVFRAGAADALFPPFTADALETSLGRVLSSSWDRTDGAESRPEGRLHFLDETGKERWVPIVAPRYTIGRSSNSDLVFANMSISRAHAEIILQDGEYHLKDLGSKHGTFVDGNRVELAKLKTGDRIQLGGPQGQNITFHSGDLLQSLIGRSDTKPEISLPVRGFREIGMLLETFRALSSIPIVDDLLALVVDTAIELTGAERGFIMLKETDQGLIFRCARNNAKRALDGVHFQTSRRVPEEVFTTGKRVVITDLDMGDSDSDHSSTRRLGLRSIFCVPLRYHTFRESTNVSGVGRMETIGVLYVDSQNIGAGLSSTQIDALETLASEAAMAIYNARLFRDSQEKRKMDEELAIAREIQQALLPPPHKLLPYVEALSQNLPCHEVGGDYFDYFDMEGDRLGFALGDVAGKGMPAALLTSMIQGIFSAQTLVDLPLTAIISNVNRHLVRRSTGNRFVTFFFGILDSEGNCTYTNAGHNPPYHLRPDGSLSELTDGGMVLGLFAGAEYESRTIRLGPGDHLVLFTDGVLEARNTQGEEFGDERLRALLEANARSSTTDLIARLRGAVTAFSANTPQHDDITMMVLSYKWTATG